MTSLTWKRHPNGDRQATEHPIRLIKPMSRRGGDAGWIVKVPLERDPNFDDGWHWTAVTNPEYGNNRGGMHLEGGDYNEARALVSEHLTYILEQIPPDYGQPAAEPPSRGDRSSSGMPSARQDFAYEQVATAVRSRIADGSLSPGAQVPSETDLMNEHGVSRIVVRQALQMLRIDGAITTQQGRGSFVAPVPSLEETHGWRCGCGCGTPVSQNSVYAPGHDARHRDQLVDLLVGRGTVRDRANRISHLILGLKGH